MRIPFFKFSTLNRGGCNVRDHGGVSSYTQQLQEKIKEKPIRFWCIVLLTHCSHVHSLQSIADVFKREVVSRRFFQFWLIFRNWNYQSRSTEYKSNWCCHHTLHLKEKTFPILGYLFKTSGTTTKVPSCLKIPLTGMRIDRFESCENIVPRFLTWSIFPTHRTGP